MPGKSGQQPRRAYATSSPQTLLGFLQIRSNDSWGAIKGAASLPRSSKVYFPKLVEPTATAVVAFVDFLITFLIFHGITTMTRAGMANPDKPDRGRDQIRLENRARAGCELDLPPWSLTLQEIVRTDGIGCVKESIVRYRLMSLDGGSADARSLEVIANR